MICIDVEFAGLQGLVRRLRFEYLETLPAELGVGSGPWLKATDAVVDFGGRAGEIHEAVFFLENRGKCRLRIVLGMRTKGVGPQTAQCLDQHIGTYGSEPWCNCFGSVVRLDREFVLKKNVAGIEARVNAHRGDPGDGFAARNGPLDGCSTAIFRKQRRMQVDVPEWREIE